MPKTPQKQSTTKDPVKETIKTKKEKPIEESKESEPQASSANIERPKVCSEQGSFCILLFIRQQKVIIDGHLH